MNTKTIEQIKREESKTIQQQIDEFFGKGGKITKVADGASGEKKRTAREFSI